MCRCGPSRARRCSLREPGTVEDRWRRIPHQRTRRRHGRTGTTTPVWERSRDQRSDRATRDRRCRSSFGRIGAMCHPSGSRPPDLPAELLRPISGGAAGEDAMLVSADGTRFRGYLARADDGDAGVVINPDVRGLHPFYEELAERFASAGVNAIAFDYFGRSAGTDRRADAFEYMPHVRETRPQTVYADIAATRAHLQRQTGARRIFVLGFCFGGRLAFL
ncbi:MAG: hypothetical protein E6H84_10275, partial [Chloroflexi bacterium]